MPGLDRLGRLLLLAPATQTYEPATQPYEGEMVRVSRAAASVANEKNSFEGQR